MTDQPLDDEKAPPPHGYAPGVRKPDKGGADPGKTGNKLAAGFAVGIGSAALVAALLYAGRKKPKPPKSPGPAPRTESD
jgi:hypothetical protein